MKVTQVAICPSEGSTISGRPALTPELLAACGARYSRNSEGLEAILAKVDLGNLEKSVDSIFRMIDYGHQSIADMVPLAMFVDGISIWSAYLIWSLCPTAGGQESSTRYIKISDEGLIAPELLGIPPQDILSWRALMHDCFQAYQATLTLWEDLAKQQPHLMGIPLSLVEEQSETARKKVARMKRNYAFDRARYLLPVGAATNVMLVMPARGWVSLCQFLLSHPLPEPQRIGELIRAELELSVPRLLKFARRSDVHQQTIADEFEQLVQMARARTSAAAEPPAQSPFSAVPFLSVMVPDGVADSQMAKALAHHQNRYSPVGNCLRRTAVRFGWSAVGFAEIRDLNRHRTGTKYCPQVPSGFYFALDQLPRDADARRDSLIHEADAGRRATAKALDLLGRAEPSYIYWTVLGTEYPFEHTTTADKFLYEAELRTGLGAHYRYARHLRDVLALWYERFPATRGLVLEGTAEPE